MSTLEIRKRLADYIKKADDKKVRAIYTMVEDEIASGENIWNDQFVAEMDRRVRSFENGKSKGFTWTAVVKEARRRHKTKNV